MSFDAFREVAVARSDGRLSGGIVLAVGLSMVEHTDHRGELHAGVRRLADWAGVSKSTAARGVAAIVDAGVYHRVVTSSGHRPAAYCLASHYGDTPPVDNLGPVSQGRDAIASQDRGQSRGLASHTAIVSLVSPVLKPRSVSQDRLTTPGALADALTDPDDVPSKVAELRARRRNGSTP